MPQILAGGAVHTDKRPIEEYEASRGETFGAAFDRAVDTGLGDIFTGAAQTLVGGNPVALAQSGGRLVGIDVAAELDPSRRIYAADARLKAEQKGVKLDIADDAYFSPGELDTVLALKVRERQQTATLTRRPQTWGGFAAEMAGGLAGSLTDPAQVAASFIPVVPAARYAMWLERAGSAGSRALIRTGVGAAEGLVGSAVLEPAIYSRANSIGLEYGAEDSFMNLAFGTILGGGLHAVGGAAFDTVTGRYAVPDDLSRVGLTDSVVSSDQGRGVNVADAFDNHVTKAAIADIERFRSQLTRVSGEEEAALARALRSERGDVKAQAGSKIESLTSELEGIDADLRTARSIAENAVDEVTPARIAAISRELDGDISPKRRADLEAERQLLTEGAADTPANQALDRSRALSEIDGLEKARARTEKAIEAERNRLAKADATEAKGENVLSLDAARVNSRRGDVVTLTTRSVRRWAASVGMNLADGQADTIATRLLAADPREIEGILRAELGTGGLTRQKVMPDDYDPATGYEPPANTNTRMEAERAVVSRETESDIDGEIAALDELIARADKRTPLTEGEMMQREAANAYEVAAKRSGDSYKAAAACLSGVA